MLSHFAFRWRRAASAAGLAVSLATMPIPGSGPAFAQTFGTDQHSCDRSALSQILSTSKGNLIGSAAGAALGGLLGNQFGKGSGNTLMTVVGVVGGALASGYVGRSMDPTDQACVGQTLEHTPTNQTVAWRNPDNGSSYWVTPISSYQGQNGEPCRNYVTQAVVNGETQRSDGTACRQANGSWRPVSYHPASRAPAAAAVAAPAAGAGAPLSADTILKVQQRLHDLGFYVRDNIDGVWGPHTMAAVGNFQRSRGLNPTGQLDLQTMNALGLDQSGGEVQPAGGAQSAAQGGAAPTQ